MGLITITTKHCKFNNTIMSACHQLQHPSGYKISALCSMFMTETLSSDCAIVHKILLGESR